MTPQERATNDLLMWAVAAASMSLPPSLTGSSCVSGYVESLNNDNGTWRVMLFDHLRATQHRRGLLALLASTVNSVLPPDEGWEGRVVQRINGILDILDVDVSAEAIAGALDATIVELRQASQTAGVRHSISAGKMAASFVAGLHGQFWAVKHIDKAGDYVAGLTTSGDETIDRTAQLVLASQLLSHTGDDDAAEVIRTAVDTDMTNTAGRVQKLKEAINGVGPGPGGDRERLTVKLRPLEQHLRVLRAAAEAIPRP